MKPKLDWVEPINRTDLEQTVVAQGMSEAM